MKVVFFKYLLATSLARYQNNSRLFCFVIAILVLKKIESCKNQVKTDTFSKWKDATGLQHRHEFIFNLGLVMRQAMAAVLSAILFTAIQSLSVL